MVPGRCGGTPAKLAEAISPISMAAAAAASSAPAIGNPRPFLAIAVSIDGRIARRRKPPASQEARAPPRRNEQSTPTAL